MEQALTASAAFLRTLIKLDDTLSWSSAFQPLTDFLLSHLLSLTALVLVTLCLAHGYLAFFHRPLRLIRHFQKQGIRGPPFRPIVGHMPEVMAGIKETAETGEVFPNLVRWRKLYGDVFYYTLGTQVRLAILDPELGHKVLSATSGPKGVFQKDENTRLAYEPMLGASGLVLATNDIWPRQRKLANPMFYHSKIKDLFPMMADCTNQLVRKWDEKLEAGGGRAEIEVWAEFTELARDILCGAVFGDPKGATAAYSGQDIYGDFGQLMKDMIAQLLGLGPKLIPGYKYLPTARNKRVARLRHKVHGMLESIIQSRREAGAEAAKRSEGVPDFGDDLLGRLLSATDEEGTLSSAELMDQCKTFFFAGHETTATSIAWTLMLLAQHPEWADKARDEIRTFCGNSPPDVASIANLKVVNMVVTESLRLFPPIFFSGRQAVNPTTLEGIHIPSDPGMVIVLPVVNYHRDPVVWGDDATSFRPDRFVDGVNQASSASAHAYMPFGIGLRGCIGQGFALQEAKLVLVTLLQKYSFKISPGYRESINIGVTITPKYGVPLIVERL